MEARGGVPAATGGGVEGKRDGFLNVLFWFFSPVIAASHPSNQITAWSITTLSVVKPGAQ